MRRYKIIQWGTGDVGLHALRLILESSDLDLVGVKCHTAAKNGRDVGEILGQAPVGIPAQADAESLLQMDADCVLFMPRDNFTDPTVVEPAWMDELIAILESGKNVVGPINCMEHWKHWKQGAALKDRLDAACAEGNASLFFTGIDPGVFSDALPIVLSSSVGRIEQIRTLEDLDYGKYNPEALQSIGFGRTADEAIAAGSETTIAGWGGSLYHIADALGVTIDEVKRETECYLSPETWVTGGGLEVKAGTVGAIQWKLNAMVSGKPRIVIHHVSRVGPHMAPDWPRVGSYGGYGVEIDSTPRISVQIPIGMPGGTGDALGDAVLITAARVVNAIAAVVEAKPGYLTVADLPNFGGRHSVGAFGR